MTQEEKQEVAAKAVDEVAKNLRQAVTDNAESDFIIRIYNRVAELVEEEAQRYRNNEIEL